MKRPNIVMGLDPGTEQTGWCLYSIEDHTVVESGTDPNPDTLQLLLRRGYDVCVVERFQSYGMAIGQTTIDAIWWAGYFSAVAQCDHVHQVFRKDVKLTLCGSPRAKDGNVRQAVMDAFPATGGGKRRQIGTKKQPGPLYGVANDAWSAVALALTYCETILPREFPQWEASRASQSPSSPLSARPST